VSAENGNMPIICRGKCRGKCRVLSLCVSAENGNTRIICAACLVVNGFEVLQYSLVSLPLSVFAIIVPISLLVFFSKF
jgi:hypothetical protein